MKLWNNIISLGTALRDIFFAYTYNWFAKAFVLKHSNASKDQVFSDLRTIDAHQTEDGSIRILEIGTGPGYNFSYFPEKCKYISVDTNSYFKHMLVDNLKQYPGVELENYMICGGEDLSMVASNSVHAVITSHVQCSVNDIQQVLREIYRILVPGGTYFYFEHVLDKPRTIRSILQKLSNKIGLQRAIGHGCRFINFERELQKGVFESYTGKWYYLPDSWDFNFILYGVKSNFGGHAIKTL